MNEKVQVIFGLVGGLALFLYGMNSMSVALQRPAVWQNSAKRQSLQSLTAVRLLPVLPQEHP